MGPTVGTQSLHWHSSSHTRCASEQAWGTGVEKMGQIRVSPTIARANKETLSQETLKTSNKFTAEKGYLRSSWSGTNLGSMRPRLTREGAVCLVTGLLGA